MAYAVPESSYVNPANINRRDTDDMASQIYQRKMNLWSIKRTVQFLSIIDFFFTLLYVFTPYQRYENGELKFTTINLIALCLCILPVMGYFGAKRYDKNYLIGYIIYNVISICGNIAEIYIGINDNYAWFTIWTILGIAVDVWIIKILVRFINLIKNAAEYEMISLRDGWTPDQDRVAWILY